jgi:hypothetical protein
MKLKPVVASLFVLGLVSGSAFAAGNQKPVQQAIVDGNSVISPVCSDNWFNRISIGGIGTFQAAWGNTDFPGSLMPTPHSTDLYVNNFNLLMNAVLNSWTKATLNLAYIGYPDYDYDYTGKEGVSHPLDSWYAERWQSNRIIADEAYVTFSNFNKTPFYFQVGKKYIPFGVYSDPYNFILTPMTQQMTQNNQTAAVLGFATDFGFYGNVYAFRGNSQPDDADSGFIRNFGAELGYYGSLGQFDIKDAHYNLNVGIIRAIQDGDYWLKLQPYFMSYSGRSYFENSDPIAGLSVHGDLTWKQLSVYANFVTVLKNVVPSDDLSFFHISDPNYNSKIWAADVNADYAFDTWCHRSKVGLSYQFTGNGQVVGSAGIVTFPKTRIQADYKVNLLKNVDFDVAVAHNTSFDYLHYSFTDHVMYSPVGSETSNVVVGKLSIQF